MACTLERERAHEYNHCMRQQQVDAPHAFQLVLDVHNKFKLGSSTWQSARLVARRARGVH
jgi:hypothetical protein